MTSLQLIQSFVQQTVSIIAAVLEVEVVAIDEQLRIVAGTGIYFDSYGLCMDSKSISASVIKKNKTIIVTNPRQNSICKECLRQEKCPDIAEICLPITMENQVIGVLAIVALNEEQKQTILDREKKLINFVARISEIFSMVISNHHLTNKLDFMAKEFETVVNSVHDGIIAMDLLGTITQVNNVAEKMLKRTKLLLIGKKIGDIFPDPFVINAMSNNSLIVGKEIYSVLGNRKQYYLANLTHIKNSESQINGYVLVIRSISEVGQIVGNYISNSRQVFFEDIKSVSSIMASTKNRALQVSQSDSTVLIQGESGTGKELFARAIHSASSRCDGPFVALNCGAIPEALMESEVFGYEEGAFSGAKRGGKIGRLELANKGTIFFDEIGDLPLHLQVKLLRIFENKVIDRLGGVRPISVDVRIIAATHKDLQSMVNRGEFREDLYYRLSVIPIFIPPLRERREDIGLYVDHFINKFNAIINKNIQKCSNNAMELLCRWNWPGNVRELENAIEFAINMEQSDTIQLSSLPTRIQDYREEQIPKGNIDENAVVSLAETEKQEIIKALIQYGVSSQGKVIICEKLGLGIATFYRKIKKYGIILDEYCS
ncbi:MAG: sigma 54-interacting transcriptional regulator [Negativicutes bacterium]